MQQSRLRQLALSVLLASGLHAAQVQAQPGTAVADSAVSQDIKTLFSLAAQVYPAFASANGSGYYSYSGFTYKFFAASGVYAGIKDGQVFLMGGPYGSSPSMQGTVSNLTTALQTAVAAAANTAGNVPTGSVADFAGITSVKTTYDLPRLFQELTFEWVGSGLTSQLKMERQGVETVSGISTEKLKVTLTGTTLPTPSVSEMWVDSTGTVRRYIANGFEYAPATADLIGRGLVSGMLLALAAADAPTIQTAIANELKNPALSTKVSKKAIGGGTYDTLSIVIGTSASLNYSVDLTDFGTFSMATRYQANIGSFASNGFQVLSMKLR